MGRFPLLWLRVILPLSLHPCPFRRNTISLYTDSLKHGDDQRADPDRALHVPHGAPASILRWAGGAARRVGQQGGWGSRTCMPWGRLAKAHSVLTVRPPENLVAALAQASGAGVEMPACCMPPSP